MLDPASIADRSPEWIRRAAYRVASGRGFVGHIADVIRFRFRPRDIPALPAVSDASTRVVIGPTNSAGQGYQWARSVERFLPGAAAMSIQRIIGDPFLPDVDLRVPVAVYQRSNKWHAALEAYLAQQTHLIWESGLPLLGRRFDSDVLRELAWSRDRGVRGALMFHGSDIRPPARHAAENRWSPFRNALGATRVLEENAARNAALAQDSGAPVFVSTPDLLRWLPEATWLPVVVDSDKWRASTRAPNTIPVVVHVPSQKWLKGTAHIEPMLRRLASEGVIEYRQIAGVSHASMPAVYADADIVLDQFLLGSYGVTACEAMAAGKMVIGHVDDFTRTLVWNRTGLELPVREATIESLEAVLRRVVAEPSSLEELRTAGPNFVEAVHSGRRSAAVIAPFLGLNA